MNEPNTALPPAAAPPRRQRRRLNVPALLGSLKFGLTVIALIALACVAGTVIPQGEQAVRYLERHPGAHRLMHVLNVLGLTDVFRSRWFIALLLMLAASLLVCTARRGGAIGRTRGAARVRVLGSFVTHVSLLLVLAGGVVRGFWGQRGTMAFREGETVNLVSSPRGAFPLPFAVRLVSFELERYEQPGTPPAQPDTLFVQWPAENLTLEFPVELNVDYAVAPPGAAPGSATSFNVRVLRYVPDFVIDGPSGRVWSRSDEPNNPAILVSVTGGGGGGPSHAEWVFARFPGFTRHDPGAASGGRPPLRFRYVSGRPATAMAAGETAPVKAFRSTLDVLEDGLVVKRATVEVNAPLSYRGYSLYQFSYNAADPSWTALQVVRDPGVPLVYAGFALMMTGLTLVFCVGPWLGPVRPEKGDDS
jgi:hypothetical protein